VVISNKASHKRRNKNTSAGTDNGKVQIFVTKLKFFDQRFCEITTTKILGIQYLDYIGSYKIHTSPFRAETVSP